MDTKHKCMTTLHFEKHYNYGLIFWLCFANKTLHSRLKKFPSMQKSIPSINSQRNFVQVSRSYVFTMPKFFGFRAFLIISQKVSDRFQRCLYHFTRHSKGYPLRKFYITNFNFKFCYIGHKSTILPRQK